jgi:MFS family permease
VTRDAATNRPDTPTDDRWLYAWAVGYAAVGAASVLLPLYALSLGADAFHVGLMASSAAFAGVPGALLWGRLAGRTGRRRPFVVVALWATASVLTVTPFLSDPRSLVAANAVLWFFVSAAAPVLNLVVVEGVPESEWDGRIARLNALQGYGWLAGLVVGTVWTLVAPRFLGPVAAQRLLVGGLGALSLAAVGLFGRWYPAAPTTSPARFARRYRTLGREGWGAGRTMRAMPYGQSRIYWGLRSLRPGRLREKFGLPLAGYLAASALFAAGFSVFWGPMPAHLVDLGFGDGTVFVLFLVGTVGSTVCYEPVGRLTRRVAPHGLQFGALAFRAALFVATAFLAGSLLVGVSFAAIGVTWAVIAVTTTGIVTRLAPPPVRGDALGLVAALAGLGGGVGNAVGGLAAETAGPVATFGLAAAAVVAGGLLGTFAVVRGDRPAPGGTTGRPTGCDE